jgi:hypothetical protein
MLTQATQWDTQAHYKREILYSKRCSVDMTQCSTQRQQVELTAKFPGLRVLLDDECNGLNDSNVKR